jgi:hypothetical protein
VAGCKARTARADAFAADLRASGARSLRAIARGLNERGIRTPRGTGEWKAGTVAQNGVAALVGNVARDASA